MVRRYEYKSKRWVLFAGGAFFAACGIGLTNVASNNDRGLIINRVITLSQGQATAFYWVLAVLSFLFVAGVLVVIGRSFGPAMEIVIDDDGVTAPRSTFNGVPVTVPFATITALRLDQVQSQRFLTITHAGGKLLISKQMMPSAADFDEATSLILAAAPQR